MPIRSDLRNFYRGAWSATRKRILERAGDRCELCGVHNHRIVWRTAGWWLDGETGYRHPAERETRVTLPAAVRRTLHLVKIVLTIAHLNHVPGDDRDENLKALCQWCHLNYDKLHHAETRAGRKDSYRPLLTEAR